jgi:hypothetical protein
MSKSVKSDLGSDNLSILKFMYSPNLRNQPFVPARDINIENIGTLTPNVERRSANRFGSLYSAFSPGPRTRIEVPDLERDSSMNAMFMLPNIHSGVDDRGFLGSPLPPFKPIIPVSSLIAPKPRTDHYQIVANSKMLFNPLKSVNSPIDRSFIMQENIFGRSTEQSSKVISFPLRKLNSLHKVWKVKEDPVKVEKVSSCFTPKAKRGIKKLKRKDGQKYSGQLTNDKNVKKYSRCNCKHSECQKDYCECFRNGGFCGPTCKCQSCKNTPVEKIASRSLPRAENLAVVKKPAMVRDSGHKLVLRIEPFDQPAQKAPGEIKCNCKKSMCVKKYCDCFSSGAFCTGSCNCTQCANVRKRDS